MTEEQARTLENSLLKLRADIKSLRQDLAALKKEKAELKKRLNTLALLNNAAPSGVGLFQQGRLVEINQTALSMLGYPAEEIIGHDLLYIIHPDYRIPLEERLKNWGTQNKIEDSFETRLLTKNNDILHCDLRVNKTRLNGRTAFVLSITDAEKRIRREKEHLTNQKNLALITLTSGIAGRLSQYLHPLTDNLSCLREVSQSQDDRFKESVHDIDDLCSAIQRTIQQLNRLNSRPHPPEKLFPGMVNDLIQKALGTVQSRLAVSASPKPEDILFKTFYRSKSVVPFNPDEMEEALVHLLMNSCEAMPEGGDVFITTEEHDDFAHIYIQDNGLGIPEEVMDRIFDPFYTSRGQHSGLGLSVARSIITRHHGILEVTSLQDQGTTFHLKLPLEKSASLPLNRMKKKKKLSDSRLLIICHDPVIRELISQLFREKGCAVMNAETGLEGIYYMNRKRFDLVITDMKALGPDPNQVLSRCRITNGDSPLVGIWPQKLLAEKDLINPSLDFDLFYSEPIDLHRLVKDITYLLKNGRMRRR